MKITVFDEKLVKKSAIYSWVSLSWRPEYNDVGFFILSMRHSSENFNSIKEGWFLTFDEDETKTIMLVDTVQVNKGIVAFSGKSAAVLLKRRVSTTVIGGQDVETAIQGLISDMEPIDIFSLGEAEGITDADVFVDQVSDKQIIDYVKTIAQSCDVGFKTIRQGEKIVFSLYKPDINNTIKFAHKFGNVGKEKYTKSETEYYNVALVAGAGEGEERITVWSGNTELEDINRRELYVDARDLRLEEDESMDSYRQRLIARGEQRLLEQVVFEDISFEVSDNVQLGEIINVYLDKIGLSIQARITSLNYVVQNNKLKKTIDVGIPIKLNRR